MNLGFILKRNYFVLFFDSAVNTCFSILEENGFTIFVKRPKYAKRLIFGKDYVGSEIELDLIEELVKYGDVSKKKLSEFRNEKYVNVALKEERKSREEFKIHENRTPINNSSGKGFCIRCSTSIPLDIEKPLCYSCYKDWAKYENPFFQEKYCISCGDKKPTSFKKPACISCYKDLKK